MHSDVIDVNVRQGRLRNFRKGDKRNYDSTFIFFPK